jgi:hypothetical protein
VLYSDIMHIDSHCFLVTMWELLQLTLHCAIERESMSVLGIALQGQLELLRSKGFNPLCVHMDPQFVLCNYHKFQKCGDQRGRWRRFCTESGCQN